MKPFFTKVWQGIHEDLSFIHSDFRLTVIKCAVLAASLIATIFVPFFIWVTLGFGVLFVVIKFNGRCLYLFAFMLPFMDLFKSSWTGLTIIVSVIAVVLAFLSAKFIVDVVKKRKKVDWFFTVCFFLVLIYVLIPASKKDFLRNADIAVGVVFLYIVFVYRDELNFKEIFLLFFLGTAISFAFGFLRNVSPLLQSQSIAWPEARYSGLSSDPNVFAVECLICLGMLYALFINREMKLLFYPMFTLLTVAVILSMSKAAFVIYIFGFIGFLITYLIKFRNKKTVFIVIAAAAALCVICVIFWPHIDSLVDRFQISSPSSSSGIIDDSVLSDTSGVQEPPELEVFLDQLTTGRYSIWKTYVKNILGSAVSIIFGHGVNAPYIGEWNHRTDWMPHNTYIDVLYYIGVLGFAVLMLWLYSAFRAVNRQNKEMGKKLNYFNLIAILILLFCLFPLSLFSSRLAIYVFLIGPSLTYFGLAADRKRLLEKKEAAREKDFEGDPLVQDEKCSVVIPIYKMEPYLRQCVDSVLNQTYKNIEVILVDDGSPDKCPEICDEYAKKDSRVRVVHKPNGGLSDARNAGIAVAVGEWVALLDADDEWKSDKLEKQFRLAKEKDAKIVYTGYEFMNHDGTLTGKVFIPPERVNYKQLLPQNVISSSTVMVKTDIMKRNPYFVKDVSVMPEDFPLWLTILKNEVDYAYGVQESLKLYRMTNNSISRSKKKMIKRVWNVYKYMNIRFIPRVFLMIRWGFRGLRKYGRKAF